MIKDLGFNCFFSIFLVSLTRKSLIRKVKWALTHLTQQTGRIPVAINWKSKRKKVLHIYEENQRPVWLATVFHGLLLYFVITACPYCLVTHRTASPWWILTVLRMDSWNKDDPVSLWQRKLPANARSWTTTFGNKPLNPRQDESDPSSQELNRGRLQMKKTDH